jgi:transcriptional regulator with XRE-family HTH domain
MPMIKFSKLLTEAERDDEYWVEAAKIDFAVELNRAREAAEISKSELARRLGTSKAYITKVLRGDTNFTIETMVRVARAVGAFLHLHVDENQVDAPAQGFIIQISGAQSGRPQELPWAIPFVVAGEAERAYENDFEIRLDAPSSHEAFPMRAKSTVPNTH